MALFKLLIKMINLTGQVQPPTKYIYLTEYMDVFAGRPADLIINDRIFKFTKLLGLFWTLRAAEQL